MSRKKEATAKQTTRQLIGIDEITDSGLKTSHGRLIFFAIKPTNLSVQPPEAVSNRIYALMTVLKGQAEIEMLALNSKESFEDNKRHYRQRAAEEDLPVISRLLEADAKSLDRLQIQMATAREFFILVRLREETGMELHTHLSRIQKSLEILSCTDTTCSLDPDCFSDMLPKQLHITERCAAGSEACGSLDIICPCIGHSLTHGDLFFFRQIAGFYDYL